MVRSENQIPAIGEPNAFASAGLAAERFVNYAPVSPQKTSISRAAFGVAPDKTPVEIFALRNRNGMEARITNYGGIVTSLKTADKNEKFTDVVLGFDKLEDYTNENYLKNGPYLGAIIGRYGNRIAHGKFSLNGKSHSLAKNNGTNSLHGGLKGFDKVVWQVAETKVAAEGAKLKLTYSSHDGEEGFPGNLNVTATYTLTEDDGLKLEFEATTDKATICNLTHHSYFNLAGHGEILNHVAQINADKFTPVDSNLIPTGELRSVKNSPFDFLKPTPIGSRINDRDEQLKLGCGYDHNFVLNKKVGELSLAARVFEPTSGRVMEVWTTDPGVQFYTGNFLDGKLIGSDGRVFKSRNGFCFEPQHFPDSPNKPEFPSPELHPGEIYQSTMIYRFSAE